MSDDTAKQPACDRCHRRKAKCDKACPQCSSCAKAEVQCIYSPKDPLTRRQDVEKLERRLRQMQAKNDALSNQLRDAHRRASDAATSSVAQSNQGLPQAASINNEVASQVTHLSLGAGGERQYLGSTSGLLLANLLQTDGQSRNRGVQEDESYNAARTFGSAGHQGDASPHAGTLPPEKLARSLVSAYLAHDHLCYPFLNARKVLNSLDSIYQDNSFYRKHHIEAFTLDMILAIATAQVSKFDWQVMPDAETHHDKAMGRLGLVLATGGSAALQALLLLCQYRIGSGQYDASASLWHLVGTAARMCFELGLHRESIYYVSGQTDAEVDEAALEVSEVNRRCFWCVLAMDRITSITLGRPLAIHWDDFDTELPSTEATIAVSPENRLSPAEPVGSAPYQLRTAIFVLIVRYRLICGRILTSLHNVIRTKAETPFNYETRRNFIIEELEAWKADTFTLPLGDSLSESDRSSYRNREWYELLYQNAILMLYRPSPSFQDVVPGGDTLQRIYDASQRSISIYAFLHKSRRINYSSITLHAVFIAGLSYIYAVRSHLQIRRRGISAGRDLSSLGGLSTDPTINQIVNTTRDCSNVLVAVSERWSTARDAYQVYGRLSDALLSDLVDFQSQARDGFSSNVTQYAVPNHEQAQNTSTSEPNPLLRYQIGQSFSPAPMVGIDFSYLDSFQDLQNFYPTYDLANASVMQASHDWLYEIQSLDQSNNAFASGSGAN